MVEKVQVRSESREEMIDVTPKVTNVLEASGVREGICVVYSQHTTCGVTVNENADPDVQSDMLGLLKRLIPQYEPKFKHAEENSDAHIKTSLVGSSATIPISDGKLMLGRWQAIYLCEFDGPRNRNLVVSIL
jgi:secondary thiamine-phosphate synthase enzyme